jgi:hypothetical protein
VTAPAAYRKASAQVAQVFGTHNMTGDHHGQTAGRATLLARAVDATLH